MYVFVVKSESVIQHRKQMSACLSFSMAFSGLCSNSAAGGPEGSIGYYKGPNFSVLQFSICDPNVTTERKPWESVHVTLKACRTHPCCLCLQLAIVGQTSTVEQKNQLYT